MFEPSFIPWAIILVGGMIVLGAVIAYGVMQNSRRTRAERMASERATHQLYEREDRAT